MNSVALATDLVAEAATVDERRLLVLAGDREVGYSHLEAILDTIDVPISETTLVGPDDRLRCEHLTQSTADRLLGTTRNVVAIDAHRACRPNALGRVVGAVDGGGLLILLTPSLETWPDRRDVFDEALASPPYTVDDVTGHFRRRLVETLETHPGIGIVDVDADQIGRSGLTEPAPRLGSQSAEPIVPADAVFPDEAFEACLTADQLETVEAFEPFLATSDQQTAVVVESDRGRGKSSAAGLAAGALAAAGRDIAITAPSPDGCREVFARARELVTDLDATAESDRTRSDEPITPITTDAGGRVRFAAATETDSWIDEPDVVIVDEAAALPVSILERTLAADRVAYATTVHGYEGTGRGFDVRFRDRLDDGGHDVRTESLAEPIRYAAGDPVETWAFRALALDARPPVEPLIDDATVSNVSYEHPEPKALVADEHRLRETFGLLVLAHYRTEPTDLARMLDAPNVTVRTLERDGHVVAVALLAREGGLDADWRADMYEGARIRGNMIPDVLTSQLRDESAGIPVGYRIVRIATHHAVRSRGLGSHLLSKIREELGSEADWLGSGFGATPELLRFWHQNGYEAIHASTTRNDRSGEYSAIVVHPTSERGETLRDRHATWFARRLPTVLADTLDDLHVDTARAVLRSLPAEAAPALPRDPHSWQVVAGAAYGPGLFDVDPGPFRPLIVRAMIDRPELPGDGLSTREERLLVGRGLQARAWSSVADELDYHSTGQCMRSFGDALTPLVDHYGTDAESVGEGVAEIVRTLRTRFGGE